MTALPDVVTLGGTTHGNDWNVSWALELDGLNVYRRLARICGPRVDEAGYEFQKLLLQKQKASIARDIEAALSECEASFTMWESKQPSDT
jgi:hypothetical protein